MGASVWMYFSYFKTLKCERQNRSQEQTFGAGINKDNLPKNQRVDK